MATIEQNQRRAFVAQATDAAAILASRLKPLSPAQQAAILASVAHECGCPVDIVLTTHESRDGMEAAMVLDGDLAMSGDGSWCWVVGSGCTFQIVVLP